MPELEFPTYDSLCGKQVFFRYNGNGEMSLAKIVRYYYPNVWKVVSFIKDSARNILEHPEETEENAYMRFASRGGPWILPEIARGNPDLITYLTSNFPRKSAPGYVDLSVGLMPRDNFEGARAALEHLGPHAYLGVMKSFGTDLWVSSIPVEDGDELYHHEEFDEGRDVIEVLATSPDMEGIKAWANRKGEDYYERIHEHLDLVYNWLDSAYRVLQVEEESEITFLAVAQKTLQNTISSFSVN